MRIRHAAVAGATTLALAAGLLSALGTVGASAAGHGSAPGRSGAGSGGRSGLEGWGSAANKAISNRIDADLKSLAARGIKLTEWGPDPASGKVKIYLTHYSNAARHALEVRYGTAIVVSRQSMPRPSRYGRTNDTVPFAGGDFVTTPLGGCTSGPTVIGNASGNPFMLLAGHCATVNSTIKTHGVTMGHVTNVRFCNICIDSETVSGNYADVVWGAGSGSSPLYNEDGALFAQPGQGQASLVTNDSAYSGEIRGITVQAVNQSVTFSDGITTRLLTKTSKSGATICRPGDSGGPWIQHEGNTGNVKVVGTTVGGTGTTCYYQQINDIDNWFNVHVP